MALTVALLLALLAVASAAWLYGRMAHYRTLAAAQTPARESAQAREREPLETARLSKEHLRRFYEAGLVGMIYWNTDGRITEANDRFLEMVGYTRRELEDGQLDWQAMGSGKAAFDYCMRLVNACKELGITCLMTNQTRASALGEDLSGLGFSSLVDTVLQLQFVPNQDELRRSLVILKARGSNHSPRYHGLRITDHGLVVSARPVSPDDGSPGRSCRDAADGRGTP